VDRLKSRVRYTLGTLFAINLLNFYDRAIFGAVAEPIRQEWALTDSQIGWLATAFTLLYAVVGVPLGRLSDRGTRSRLLAFGVAAWSALTAASGLAWNYGSLFAARLGVGVGEAVCAPACNSLIGDLYPPARRARALAVFMLGLPMGLFLGGFVSGHVAARYGWRMAFYIACVPGLLVAMLAMRVLDPPRGAAEDVPQLGVHSGSPYWAVLKIPTIRWIIITGALFNFNSYAVVTFLPAYLSRYHALDLRQSSVLAGIVFGMTGVPGLLLGGWAADRTAAVRSSGRLLLSSASLFLSALFIYLALNLPSGQVIGFVALMGTGWTFSYMYYPSVYASIQDVVKPDLRGTAMALYFLVMYLFGGSFGPVLVGRLSDYFLRQAMAGPGTGKLAENFRAAGLHSAMYAIPVCSALLALVLLGAARTVGSDMRALRSWMSSPGSEPSTEK
jgi:MFS family permease